jgi:hypothetical protein
MMIVRGRSRLIVTDSLTRCIETLIGTTGDLFEDRVPSHTLVRMSALTKGILVAAGAICVAVFLFTVSLDSSPDAASEPAGATGTSGAASSGPVAFPTSGSRRTKAIWQDPLGASLIAAGVVVGAVIVVRGRRREPEAAD